MLERGEIDAYTAIRPQGGVTRRRPDRDRAGIDHQTISARRCPLPHDPEDL